VSPLPLSGRRVLVTRAVHQAGKLSEGLRALGAEPVEVPVLEIRPPASFAPVDSALGQLDGYDWLILTSANTVWALAERAAALGIGFVQPALLKVAAVGEATAAAARKAGLQVALVPASYVAESLIEELADRAKGKRILLARAEVARDVIPDALQAARAAVDVVDAYRNVLPEAAAELLREALAAGIDAATFTSSSSVTHLFEAARAAGVTWPLAGVLAVSIGPITSLTLRDLGWEPAAEADPHDIPGLIAAVARILPRQSPMAEVSARDADVAPQAILTERLVLIPSTEALLQLELTGGAALAARLGVRLPEDWPPGEYDRDAIQFFLEKLKEGGPTAVGWYGWYAVLKDSSGEPAALVGCGGYLGPPDEAGEVEIGYSICERWRGRGLAKELVQALMGNAFRLGARKVVAHTSEENPASISVLRSCGFRQAHSTDSCMLQFEVARST
jgi:uroporphyrinogen-III synthase/uroporphyrinogen III methyltransferase/synthase